MSKTKVWALKSSLYFEGVPYVVGNPIELPDYMVAEWLALGLVSREPPAPKEIALEGAMHKEEAKPKEIIRKAKPTLQGGTEVELE
jgi:hypothetical protein